MKEYYCLNCKTRIPLDDINMQTNIALCRACGEMNDVLLLSSNHNERVPAKQPRRCRFSSDPMAGCKLTRRNISFILLFLVPFTCFWSGLSMWGIYLEPMITKHRPPALSEALFGIPFLLGTIVLVSVILYIAFGRVEIRMHRGEGSRFYGIGPIGWRKHFRYDRDTKVRMMYRGAARNEVPQKTITIIAKDGDVPVGSFYGESEKLWIAAKLTEFIRSGY